MSQKHATHTSKILRETSFQICNIHSISGFSVTVTLATQGVV